MALLTIAHVDAEQGFSGGEEQVFLLMDGLRRRGHVNVLCCPPDSRSHSEARRRGFEVRGVPMANDLDLRGFLGLRRELKRCRADIVHLHTGRATWLGGLAAHAAELPAVTTRRQDRRVRPGWRTRLIYRSLVRRAVAISPAVARRLSDAGVSPASTTTIPDAVDPVALEPTRTRAEVRAELGAGTGDFLLLTLSALVRRKGIDVLIDALAELDGAPTVRLWVGGEGAEREALARRAVERGVSERVRFLGRRPDKADLLHASDALVLPSRLEGLGVASLEAMAASRPVLASRVGGLAATVVHERTGLLVPPEDPTALAAAITRLRDDRGLAARLGAAGPGRIAEGHLAEQMTVAYEKLYHDVLGVEA